MDSGANISIVSSLSHLDSNIFPTYLRAEKPSVVQTANNSTMDNQRRGQFEGVNRVLYESASNSLLSTSQYTREKDDVVIMSSTEAVGVKIDSTVTSHLNAIKNHSFNKNQILLAAQLNNDNLYELCDTSYIDNPIITTQSHISSSPLHFVSNNRGRLPSLLQSVENSNTSAQAATVDKKPPFPISHGDNAGATDDFSTNNAPIFATIIPTKPTIQLTTTNSLKPTSSVLYPHLFATAAYYQTAEFII